MKIEQSMYSKYMPNIQIPYTLILPKSCKRTVLWLHGYRERAEQLLANGPFERLAEQYEAAILFPDVPDTYYLNQPWNGCYTENFLMKEFLPTVTVSYDLPRTRDSLYIAGISMGGFGSLLLGSHEPELFGKIACISGAFIIDDLLIGNPEVVGSFANFAHFQNLFGDLPSLADGCERNPLLSSEQALVRHQLPPVFIACGTEDLLYTRNQKLFHKLEMAGADIAWWEDTGNHDWSFFGLAVSHVFQWLCG